MTKKPNLLISDLTERQKALLFAMRRITQSLEVTTHEIDRLRFCLEDTRRRKVMEAFAGALKAVQELADEINEEAGLEP